MTMYVPGTAALKDVDHGDFCPTLCLQSVFHVLPSMYHRIIMFLEPIKSFVKAFLGCAGAVRKGGGRDQLYLKGH